MAMQEFRISSSKKHEFIDLTSTIQRIVEESRIREGLCVVFVPHATAALVINENADPNVCLDTLDALAQLIPAGRWRHDRVDGNADSHIKASMLGASQSIPISQGRLALGTWQAISLVELDGPRERRVLVSVAR